MMKGPLIPLSKLDTHENLLSDLVTSESIVLFQFPKDCPFTKENQCLMMSFGTQSLQKSHKYDTGSWEKRLNLKK